MSLNGVLAPGRGFSSGTYTVTRRAAETDDTHGRRVAGATSTLSIVASIQPMSGRDLQGLPEGQRSDENVTIYTTTFLTTRSPTNAPDLVTFGGEPYEVFRVETWVAFGRTHYRAYAARRTTP
jgi:hypothetical protein